MTSRHDYRLSLDPQAIQLAEEIADDRKTFADDESDNYGWQASLAEDRDRRWSA